MTISRRDLLKRAVAAGAAAAVAGPAEARHEIEPHGEAVGMLFDSTLCVGCRACEAACAEANRLPEPSSDDRVMDQLRKTSPTSLTVVNRFEAKGGGPRFAKRQCMHCIEPACVSACPVAALFKTPEGPVIWNKLGIAYHQMSDLDTARRLYEKSLKLDPNYAEARNNLGTVYYARKSYRRAINDYRKALKLNPTSASIFSNLGTAYFARKKYKEAFEAYQQALNLDPEVFEHRSNYGVLLQDRTVEERAKFHYFLAKTYAQAGMNERALLYIRKSLEEGFAERKKYLEDPEFAALKDLPEFQTLMALEPRVL